MRQFSLFCLLGLIVFCIFSSALLLEKKMQSQHQPSQYRSRSLKDGPYYDEDENCYKQSTCKDGCMEKMTKWIKSRMPEQEEWGSNMCRKKPRRLILGVLWNGEWDLIEVQMENARGYADEIHVFESNVTFSGLPKPIYWERASRLFSSQQIANVRHHVIEHSKEEIESKGFAMEHRAREDIKRYLKDSDEDLVYFGDVDQVIRPHILWFLKWSTRLPPLPLYLNLRMYVYNFRHKFTGMFTGKSHFLTAKELLETEDLVHIQTKTTVSDAGWHMTWFLQPFQWADKMATFSHYDMMRPEFASLEWIRECMRTGRDPYNRKFQNGPFRNDDIDDVPEHVKNNPNRFQYMLFLPD